LQRKKREVLVLFFAVLGIRGTLKPGEMLVKWFRAGGANAMFVFVIVGEQQEKYQVDLG